MMKNDYVPLECLKELYIEEILKMCKDAREIDKEFFKVVRIRILKSNLPDWEKNILDALFTYAVLYMAELNLNPEFRIY